MGLYYSGNGFDWLAAGIVDYHLVSFPCSCVTMYAMTCVHVCW